MWKISPELATIVPYFAPMFPNLSFGKIARDLQNDKYFIEASKLLVGIIGFNKDMKSGQVANSINITPDVLGKFLGVARKGLNKQIGLVALPMDSIETVDFDVSQNNIENDYLKNVASQSIASYSSLFATEKLNSHQSKLASAIDMNFVNSMYEMFSDFVEYQVNSRTKKFKFRIHFNDMYIPDQQAQVLSNFKDLSNLGILDVQLAARACDVTPFELMRRLQMSKSMGFDKKLISLSEIISPKSSSTKTGGISTGKVGRPANPLSDNDNTEASWDRGSNELK